MGRISLFVVLAYCATVKFAVAEEAIRYTLEPVVENGTLKAISIELSLTGEADGETVLLLPNDWGGKTELWRGVSEFRVSGRGMTALADVDPARKVIRHAPNAKLTVRYRLTQFWPGDPATSGENEYRPVIRPTYFHLIGHTTFVRPDWNLATAVSVALGDMPKGWRFASDLEHRTEGEALSLAELVESVSVGGDFRVLTAGQLRVAVRGTWPFKDQDLVARLQPIIASHHRFWGDAPEPFLVTVLPLTATPGATSLGGTALGDAFAFFASPNIEDKQLTRVLAHEHMHNWIPRRIGRMPDVDDSAEYWLSEGFADFYTYRLLVRDGGFSVEEFAEAANGVLWAYGFSPARNASNAQVVKQFWTDPHVGQVPYQRGFLFATLADYRVRAASKGRHDLDDVMFEMKRDAAASAARPPPVRELFVATMKKYGVDVARDIETYIERGGTIFLPADAWGSCGRIQTSEIAEFDRGFDGRRTMANGNVVTGVDPDGPAHAAGLRDGMVLQRLELSDRGDSRVPLVLRVIEKGKVREISYLPAGKRRFEVQEFLLGAGARDGCRARLAGMS
jgi:predicted metalloprotease with PDZ domain